MTGTKLQQEAVNYTLQSRTPLPHACFENNWKWRVFTISETGRQPSLLFCSLSANSAQSTLRTASGPLNIPIWDTFPLFSCLYSYSTLDSSCLPRDMPFHACLLLCRLFPRPRMFSFPLPDPLQNRSPAPWELSSLHFSSKQDQPLSQSTEDFWSAIKHPVLP